MLRLGAYGAGAAVLSSVASSSVLAQLLPQAQPGAVDPLAPLAQPRAQILTPSAPAGIDPQLFARAKAALDQHRIYARDTIGIADFSKPSSEARFHLVDLASGQVESHRVAHARGSDPAHSGTSSVFPTSSALTPPRTVPTRPAIIMTANTDFR